MKLSELSIWTSPLTGKIYVGTISRNGVQVIARREVTDMVLEAAKQAMEKREESA